MTFLNWIMLFGLGAVAVPVVIHILNRGRGDIIHWGAMQFLLASIASQNRRILIEEALLLATRCLALAFLALAMARPFLPSTAGIPWGLVLLVVVIASVCAGVGGALWKRARLRRLLLGAVAALLVIAALAVGIERWLQGHWWSMRGGDSDIAILVDSSGSMSIVREGRTNFERAVEEVERVIQGARAADGISIYLAGPVPVPLIARPTADRRELRRVLESDALRPTGGAMGVLEALNAAVASLRRGQNPVKKIVLVTDGQSVGWQVGSDAQWSFIRDRLAALPGDVRVLCRRIPVPQKVTNVAVSDLRLSRRIIGTITPVNIDVDIVNTGIGTALPKAVNLFVDGSNVAARAISVDILPGVTETVRFRHKFVRPGPHLVSASTEWEDDLGFDDQCERAVRVIDRLPVLVIDGAPSDRPLEGASAFVETALDPREESELTLFRRVWAFLRQDDPVEKESSTETDKKRRNLVVPTVVAVDDVHTIDDVSGYEAILLMNVPRLPAAFSALVTDFVREGGGVLIAPGVRSVPEFYDNWQSAAGEPFVPATMSIRCVAGGRPVRFEPASFGHPGLRLIAERGESDVGRALARAYWELHVDTSDRDVRVGGVLANGAPLLVERQFGRGVVVMSSLMLDGRDSNLPSLKCFVPLVHELVYHLCRPGDGGLNLEAGVEFVVDVPAEDPGKRGVIVSAEDAKDGAEATVGIETPMRRHPDVAIEETGDGIRVAFADTHEPGTYWLTFATNVAPFYASNLVSGARFPFVVVGDVEESELSELGPADLAGLSDYIDLFVADTATELAMALSDEVPGEELWRYLVIAALVALIGEIGLSRWISIKRRYNADVTVDFGAGGLDVRAFRSRAEEMLEVGGDDGSGT